MKISVLKQLILSLMFNFLKLVYLGTFWGFNDTLSFQMFHVNLL